MRVRGILASVGACCRLHTLVSSSDQAGQGMNDSLLERGSVCVGNSSCTSVDCYTTCVAAGEVDKYLGGDIPTPESCTA